MDDVPGMPSLEGRFWQTLQLGKDAPDFRSPTFWEHLPEANEEDDDDEQQAFDAVQSFKSFAHAVREGPKLSQKQ